MTGYIVYYEIIGERGEVLGNGNGCFEAESNVNSAELLQALNNSFMDRLKPDYPGITRILFKGIFKL